MSRYPALVLATTWCVALAGAVVLLPDRPLWGALAVGVAVPVALLAVFVRPAVAVLALAVALLAVGRAELPAADPLTSARATSLAGAVATITGRVADDIRPSGGGSETLVEPQLVQVGATSEPGIGNVLVRWRGPTEAGFGDQVQATGKLTLPRDLPAFDRRAYLAQKQVFVELQATGLDVVEKTSGLASLPNRLRAAYTATIDELVPAPHGAMLVGIVLGVHQGMPPSLQNALIATGLIHLLVLSGLKVAVFVRIVQGALRPVLGRAATWPAVGLIGLYALTGGATPAAVRAAAMGGLAIAASHLGRPTHVWTSLSVTAAAMIGWHPELAWDVGFQLSFAGTAAIILLTPAIERRLMFMPQVFREPFAVTCAAQVGTLPMVAANFHVLSPAAPLANALTLPILPALVVAGLALGAAALLPSVAGWLALPVTGLLAYVEQVAYVLSRVPAAAMTIPAFPSWMGVAYYSALGPAVAGTRLRGQGRTLAFGGAVAAPALISIVALVAWANAPSQAVVLNVGDGQAVLLRGPRGAILIDGGPSPARLADGLGAQLPPWQTRLEALVITAPGLGHVGGLAAFPRAADTVIVPAASLSGTSWRTAALDEAARGASIVSMAAGEDVKIAGFDLQAIAPEPGAPADLVGAADLALRVVAPDGRSFCDLSDLDADAQLAAALRLRGSCTYVLLPAGGKSALESDLERAAVVSTTQLIASRGPGRLAAGYPPTVLRTDQEGAVAVPL